MNITIAGCGIVGTALAEKLTAEKHAVTVIDNNEEHLSYIMNSLDVLTILGDASAPDILEEANVKDSDLMIAVTDSDEKNLLISLVSKQLGVNNTIARVRGPQNTKSAMLLKEAAGMSMAINPEMDAAREIMNSLKYKSTQQVETIAKGTTEVLTCVVKPDAPIVNKQIMNLQKITGTKVLVCGLKRGDQVFIPTAQTEIHAGDTLSFVASNRDALAFFKKLKYDTLAAGNALNTCVLECEGSYVYKDIEECKCIKQCSDVAHLSHALTCAYSAVYKKGIAIKCQDGYYINKESGDDFGICVICPSNHACNGDNKVLCSNITHCTTCTSTGCSACEAGYNVSSNKLECE